LTTVATVVSGSDDHYEPTGISLDIFKQRYAFTESETWNEACRRLARTVAAAEKQEKRDEWQEKFYKEIVSNRFCPGGRIWFGAGRPKSNLINCFVLDVEDSREGWGKTCSDSIIVSGVGGGIGINYSKIRPKGTLVTGTGGEAQGAVAYMRIINAIAEEIRGGGNRRSAHMMILNINHGDIEEFLDTKLEQGNLKNANVSVAFNMDFDEFVGLVEKDKELSLIWRGNEFKKIKAKVLWQKIIDHSYKNGEPGLFNLNYANKMNNLYYYKEITATNPCITGDTLILARKHGDDGNFKQIPIKELAESGWQQIDVYTLDITTKMISPRIGVSPRKTQENVEIWRVTFEGGAEIKATPNHKIWAFNNSEWLMIPIKDLKIGWEVGTFNQVIESIEPCGKEDVYNLTVPNGGNYYAASKGMAFCLGNCGEISSVPYASCDLGSLVLFRFIENGKINWDKLDYTIRVATRFLDNVLSITQYPLKEIEDESLNARRIGIGVTGLHDMLLLMGQKYASEESIKTIEQLFSFIVSKAFETSTYLAVEKGVFPAYDREKFMRGGFVKTLKNSLKLKMREYGMRNSNLMSIAPTGTISMLCGNCSSGIEPIFGPAYKRKYYDKKNNDKMKEELIIHPLFDKFMSEGKDVSHFESSSNIDLETHFKIQKTVQEYVDQSISKTILIDKERHSRQEIEKLIKQYFSGLKGLTIYPMNSRSEQPISPISLQEARKLWKERNKESSTAEIATSPNSCKSGVCDL
jgi:ribonucleoside-diphosphate reductase alpha chain